MPPRKKSDPTHRNAPAEPATRGRLRRTVILSGVAVAATGIAVAGGVVIHAEAPAYGEGAVAIAIAPVDTVDKVAAESVTPTAVEGSFVKRDNNASRSARRTPVESAKEKARERDSTEHAANADPRDVARRMLPEFGFAPSEFGCLDELYVGESDWDMHADNPTSSAYGIPQALMSAHELPADYTTNASTQIRWGLGYIRDSYGTPCAAVEFKQGNGWY